MSDFTFTNAVDDLSPALRRAVRLMIFRAKHEKARASFIVLGGQFEAYAYPLNGEFAWGLNAASADWACIARGTVRRSAVR